MIGKYLRVGWLPVLQSLAKPLAAAGLEMLDERVAPVAQRDHAGPAVKGVAHFVQQVDGDQGRHLAAHCGDVAADVLGKQ